MSSAIFLSKKGATKYKQYLRKTYKTNLVIHRTKRDNEVSYTIPFPESSKNDKLIEGVI
jgi:hypothetical protein